MPNFMLSVKYLFVIGNNSTGKRLLYLSSTGFKAGTESPPEMPVVVTDAIGITNSFDFV